MTEKGSINFQQIFLSSQRILSFQQLSFFFVCSSWNFFLIWNSLLWNWLTILNSWSSNLSWLKGFLIVHHEFVPSLSINLHAISEWCLIQVLHQTKQVLLPYNLDHLCHLQSDGFVMLQPPMQETDQVKSQNINCYYIPSVSMLYLLRTKIRQA